MKQESSPVEPDGPLLKGLNLLMSLSNVIATSWILLLMALIVADVIGRNAFLAPIAGVPEMVKYSIVGIVFLQIAHTHAKGQMIRSDGLLELLSSSRPRIAATIDLVAQIAGIGFTLLLAWAVWPRAEKAFMRGEMEGVSGHFELPVWPFLAIIVFGSLLLSLSFLTAASAAWRRLSRPAAGA